MTVSKSTRLFIAALLLVAPSLALAAETPALNPANTAWLLTSSVLVLFMTIPGLALFYGGLVRTKNVLSVLISFGGGLSPSRPPLGGGGPKNARVRRPAKAPMAFLAPPSPKAEAVGE